MHLLASHLSTLLGASPHRRTAFRRPLTAVPPTLSSIDKQDDGMTDQVSLRSLLASAITPTSYATSGRHNMTEMHHVSQQTTQICRETPPCRGFAGFRSPACMLDQKKGRNKCDCVKGTAADLPLMAAPVSNILSKLLLGVDSSKSCGEPETGEGKPPSSV